MTRGYFKQGPVQKQPEKERNAWELKRDDLKWEKIYGTDSQRQDKESVLERLKNPQREMADCQQQKTVKSKNLEVR